MGVKTLTITEEAYQLLAREKKTKESFSEVIKRLTNERGKLTDSLGTWKMDDQEEQRIFSELETHWKKASSKLRNKTED